MRVSAGRCAGVAVGCCTGAADACDTAVSFGSLAFFAAVVLRVRCLGFACVPVSSLLRALGAATVSTVFAFFAVVALRAETVRVFFGAAGVSSAAGVVSAAFAAVRVRVELFFVLVLRVRFVVCSFAGASCSEFFCCCSFSTDAIVSITHT